MGGCLQRKPRISKQQLMQLRYITAILYGGKKAALGITQGCMFIKVWMLGADDCAGMKPTEHYRTSLNFLHIQFILGRNPQAPRAEVWIHNLGTRQKKQGLWWMFMKTDTL